MLIYKRAFVQANVDLTALEKVGYDPNEPDLEPINDSNALDLAVLKDDTFQLHSSGEKTNKVVLHADEILPSATQPSGDLTQASEQILASLLASSSSYRPTTNCNIDRTATNSRTDQLVIWGWNKPS